MSELDLNRCLLVLADVRNLRALLVRRFFDRRFETFLERIAGFFFSFFMAAP